MSNNQSGQAFVEYLLAIIIVIFGVRGAWKLFESSNVMTKFATVMKSQYAAVYRYGHPLAKGVGEADGPLYIPLERAEKNFRVFYNPSKK